MGFPVLKLKRPLEETLGELGSRSRPRLLAQGGGKSCCGCVVVMLVCNAVS